MDYTRTGGLGRGKDMVILMQTGNVTKQNMGRGEEREEKEVR